MKAWALGYLAALLAVTVLDGLWLGFIARDFYGRELAPIAAESVRKVPAILFYLAYPAGVLAVALWPLPDNLSAAMLRAAIVGLVAYGTYDLTNLATLRGYTVQLAALDMAWGTFITAIAGGAAFLVLKRL